MHKLKQNYSKLEDEFKYITDLFEVNRYPLDGYKYIAVDQAKIELHHIIKRVDYIRNELKKISNSAKVTQEELGLKLYAIEDIDRQQHAFKRYVKKYQEEVLEMNDLEPMTYSIDYLNDIFSKLEDEGLIKLMDYMNELQTNKPLREYCDWYIENYQTCDLLYLDKSIELFEFICSFTDSLILSIRSKLNLIKSEANKIIEDIDYVLKSASFHEKDLQFTEKEILYLGKSFTMNKCEDEKYKDHRSYFHYRNFLKQRRKIAQAISQTHLDIMEDEHYMFLSTMEKKDTPMYESFMNDWY